MQALTVALHVMDQAVGDWHHPPDYAEASRFVEATMEGMCSRGALPPNEMALILDDLQFVRSMFEGLANPEGALEKLIAGA